MGENLEGVLKYKVQGGKNLYLVRESTRKDKSNYFLFHKSHGYNTNDCIQLNDAIEGIIKNVWLSEYTKDEKMSQKESPKKKQSPKKVIEVVSRSKERMKSVEKRMSRRGSDNTLLI